jgi:hypothetical protein
MSYVVELRYIGGELAHLMRDMQAWLDRKRIQPVEFQHSVAPPGLAFRVAFAEPSDAAAFAKAFGGWVEGAHAHGTARWTTPPLAS